MQEGPSLHVASHTKCDIGVSSQLFSLGSLNLEMISAGILSEKSVEIKGGRMRGVDSRERTGLDRDGEGLQPYCLFFYPESHFPGPDIVLCL